MLEPSTPNFLSYMLVYLLNTLSYTAIYVHAMSNTWFHRNIDCVLFLLDMLWNAQWNELNPRKIYINAKGMLYGSDISTDQCE